MRYWLILFCLVFRQSVIAQTAKQNIRKMEQVHFQQPVVVLVRLNTPVPNAEYRVVMDRSLVSQLDTMTLHGLLHHPGIYFSYVYTRSVSGNPRRKYYMTAPETQDGFDDFKPMKFPYEIVERPPKGRFYTRVESANSYRYWLARRSPSDAGYDGLADTLPGVDSVRTVYIIRVRERWKRIPKSHSGKY